MVRVTIAVVLSAVVQMAWGFLFWGVLPFSQTIVQELPDEGRVMAALQETVTESGHYFAPHPSRAKSSEGEKALLEEHRRGPLVEIVYQKDGVDPMGMKFLGVGFGQYLASSLLMALLLVWALPRLETYLSRVVFIVLVAVFAVVATHLGNPIWFHHPWTFSLVQSSYLVVGWTLAGLVMGAVIRPAR